MSFFFVTEKSKMPSSATGVGMPICLLGGVLLILTQKNSQKFGDVLGIMIVGAAVSQVSLLAAFACVPLAGYQIYKLNQEDEDNWLKDEERLAEEGGKQ